MLESLERFQAMGAPELADLLAGYVTFVRAACIGPGSPAVMVTEILNYTDTVVAPPPLPCDFPWREQGSARPGEAGTAGALLATVTRPAVPAA